MDNPVLQHVAAGVRRLAPYQPGRGIDEIARERNLSEVFKLASNENPLGAGAAALRALRELPESTVSRYPDGNCSRLREAVAERLGVAAECLVFGNGSNEILELAAQLVLTPDSAAVYSRHAFVVYELATAARRAHALITETDAEYAHDLTAMAAAAGSARARLVFIANPNNPTGSWHPPARIAAFMQKIPPHVLVVLDEAYREYVDDQERPDMKFPNLLVTRTFSKIHGLAGLRIGYGVGEASLIDMLNRIRQPFNLGGAAQAAALAALHDREHVARSVQMNAAGMEQICAGLRELKLPMMPSRANFVTFGVEKAATVYEELLNAGVIVRPLSGYELPGWLRVSIGREEENARFLQTLKRLF